jgi:hypothetical protein
MGSKTNRKNKGQEGVGVVTVEEVPQDGSEHVEAGGPCLPDTTMMADDIQKTKNPTRNRTEQIASDKRKPIHDARQLLFLLSTSYELRSQRRSFEML